MLVLVRRSTNTQARCTDIIELWLRVWTEHGTDRGPSLYFGVYLLFAFAIAVQTLITLA